MIYIFSGVRENDDVSVYYDPMIAKLVVWDKVRSKAFQKLKRKLLEFHVSNLL